MTGDGVPALLVALGASGVELAPHPGDPCGVRFRCLGGRLAMRDAIQANRRRLRTLLDGYVPATCEGAYVLEERLGVGVGQGMPVHVGAPAWLVAVGEALAADLREHADVRRGKQEDSVPALEVTLERLASWDMAAAAGRRRRRKAADGAAAARAFIREAWRRVNRLQAVGGVAQDAAIDAVLAVMASATATRAGGVRSGGCVTVTGKNMPRRRGGEVRRAIGSAGIGVTGGAQRQEARRGERLQA
jgi:hypothetical protein